MVALSLTKKLVGGLNAILLLIMLIIGPIGYLSMKKLTNISSQLWGSSVTIQTIDHLQISILELIVPLSHYIYSQKDEYQNKFNFSLSIARMNFNASLEDLLIPQEMRDEIGTLEPNFNVIANLGQEILELQFPEDDESAFRKLEQMNILIENFITRINTIEEYLNELLRQMNKKNLIVIPRTMKTFLISILGILIFSSTVSGVVGRKIQKHRDKLEQKIRIHTEDLTKTNLQLKQEIVERKKNEFLINQAKQDWEDTFNTITDMITIHDIEYNILHANKAAQQILDKSIIDLKNTKCFKIYHGMDRPLDKCPRQDCLLSEKSNSIEYFEPHLNKFVEIKVMPRFDEQNQIIGFVHLVRDITQKKKDEKKIIKQFNYITSLHTVDKAISSSLDLSITLNVLLEQATRQLNIDAADVLLMNSNSNYLEFAVGRGFKTETVKSSAVRLGMGYAGRAAFERKPFIISDFSNLDEKISPPTLIKAEGFNAYYGLPLIAKGKVHGVLEIFHRSAFEFDSESLDFLNAIGNQGAIAIDNAAMFEDLHRTFDELILAYDSTIEGWSRALDFRDKETEGHSQRVTKLTVSIAREMKIKDEELLHIRRGALLHDIGKLGVPDSILLKPGKLTEEEFEKIKQHTKIAYEILSPITFLRPALDIPYYHHEKWNGTGYPEGLKGRQIPISARIFAVVDVWDALNSDRPYRDAWPKEKILKHIRTLSGSHFDPDVVDVFFKHI